VGAAQRGDPDLRGESSGRRRCCRLRCPKEVEQEEWRDACRHRECCRPEGLLLAQAESEGHWLAVGVGTGGERGAGAEAGAGQRAVLVCETRPSCH
jgi:hypothetical protein